MTRDKSIDFDRVATYYDAYVRADFDVAFWVEEARRHSGRRIELMCGTGRLMLPILRAGLALDGVDYSAGLLAELRRKIAAERLETTVFQQDVRELRLPGTYDWAFLGFHSFAELATIDDQRAALQSIRGILDDGARFCCSLHNPVVRGAQLDGQWRRIGVFPLDGAGNSLVVDGRYRLDATTGLVAGAQRYLALEADGRVARETELSMRFRMVERQDFEGLAGEAGFQVESLWGDYDRSPFDAGRSPFLIYCLR